MPITLLDVILLVVMLISALLAMVRGFMREVLSIASWGAAALLTLYSYPRLKPIVLQYFSNDIAASAVTIGGVFLGTLLIVSIVTIKISDMILDSRVGALDRTLGFVFGLGRGLVIVVVAYLFFAWLVPDRSQPEWVKSAKSLVVLKKTGDTADVDVAGRPRKHHFEAVEAEQAGRSGPARGATRGPFEPWTARGDALWTLRRNPNPSRGPKGEMMDQPDGLDPNHHRSRRRPPA